MKNSRMKKSRYVASVLRGASILVLALPVAACDRGGQTWGEMPASEKTVGEQDVKVFSAVEDCAAEADAAACEAARTTALAEHREKAPRFGTPEQCKENYPNCEEVRTSSGGSFFMPPMMGFMMGRMLSGGFGAGGGYGRAAQPVYYGRDGYASTTDRRLGVPNTGTPGGATTVRAPVTAGGDIGTRAATVSRGGFGATSSRFGATS